jgi:hypothetical protein
MFIVTPRQKIGASPSGDLAGAALFLGVMAAYKHFAPAGVPDWVASPHSLTQGFENVGLVSAIPSGWRGNSQWHEARTPALHHNRHRSAGARADGPCAKSDGT